MKIEKPGLYRTRDGVYFVLYDRENGYWHAYSLDDKKASRIHKWDSMGVPQYGFPGHGLDLVEKIDNPVIKAFYDIND